MKQKSSGSWLPAIIGAAVCIAVVTFALCSRLSHLREEAEYNAYLESISRFAKEYVLGKYGFEAEITEDEYFDNRSEWDRNKSFPGYMRARFKMTDPAGRTFFTYLQGDPLNLFGDFIYGGRELQCYDDYQHEEIKQALSDELTRAFPGGHIVKIDITGPIPYYSGDDLDKILPDMHGDIELVSSGTDLSKSDIVDRLSGSGMNIKLTCFDTPESMNSFLEKRIVTVTANDGRTYLLETLTTDYYAPFEEHIISRFEKYFNEITKSWDSKVADNTE